jgi:hypothetical protein
MGLQNYKVPILGISRLPTWEFQDSQLGSPKTKWHLGVAPVPRHK